MIIAVAKCLNAIRLSCWIIVCFWLLDFVSNSVVCVFMVYYGWAWLIVLFELVILIVVLLVNCYLINFGFVCSFILIWIVGFCVWVGITI